MDGPLIERMRPYGTSIFAEMTALAVRTGAINLGQGFPDEDGPVEVLDAAVRAIQAGHNQYPPGLGIPQLRQAVSEHQRRFYGMSIDPDTEVLITVGATEGIAAAVMSLCEPGDEVVMFEPYFDCYVGDVALAGAVRRTSVLRFPDFAVDEESLRAAFTARTKAVILNSPHNPTGKVFSAAELQLIADLAIEHDAWVISDEVYEHLTFDGVRHVPIATLPGMAERTLTISSGGKTFSTTGWKVGWVAGPAEAVRAVTMVKQLLTYVGSGPFQHAIAEGLALPDSVFTDLATDLQAKRDVLVEALTSAGLPCSAPAGTYFVIADAAPLGATDAAQFCRELPHRCGVVAVPVSVFHDDPDVARTLLRFAFCKREETLLEAARRLASLSQG